MSRTTPLSAVAVSGYQRRQKLQDVALKNDLNQKCDYTVTPEFVAPNFVHLFGRVLSIDALLFSEITLNIRNWHNAKL